MGGPRNGTHMQRRWMRALKTLLALALAGAGCGGDGDQADGGGADVAGDRPPADGPGGGETAPSDASLSPAIRASKWGALADRDKRTSCDFFVAQVGGYGRERVCPDGTSIGSLFESQAECLAAMTACDATVAEVETCYAAQARHGCAEDLPDECQNLSGTCI
jgi:hypothetical protein